MEKSFDYKELQLYRQNIMKYSSLSTEEEMELVRRYKQGDREAGQKIINANLRFVVKVSRKYFKRGHNNLEIIQEGNLGLIKALERFDPDRGVPFVYYAVWWIEAMIKTFLYKSGRAHTGHLGHAKDLLSLDEPIGNDDNEKNCWVDYLPGDSDLENAFCDEERSRTIARLLHHCFSHLSEREAFIINRRFYADPPITLTEIASELGVSKERVRQLQLRSIEKIKQVLENQGTDLRELEAISPSGSHRYGIMNFMDGDAFLN